MLRKRKVTKVYVYTKRILLKDVNRMDDNRLAKISENEKAKAPGHLATKMLVQKLDINIIKEQAH